MSLICPRCERVYDERHECRRVLTRRFFFGLLGGAASAVALPLRKVYGAVTIDVSGLTDRYVHGDVLRVVKYDADHPGCRLFTPELVLVTAVGKGSITVQRAIGQPGVPSCRREEDLRMIGNSFIEA